MQVVGGTTCNPEGITDPYLPDGSFDYDRANGHTCLGQKSIAWRFPLALQILFAWILFFGMFFFPFSPRWLMSKHRDEEAVVALSKLRRLDPNDPLIKAEILEIKAAVMFDEESDREAVEKGGKLAPWKALFAPNMFKRLVLGCGISSVSFVLIDADGGREGMMICQQFTGINAVLYYAPQIFASFGFSSSKQTLLATGVTGILQIVFTLPAVLFLDKLGRKTFLIAGAAGMFCCHIVVATVEGLYQDDWALNEGLYKAQGWVAIAFIWLFAVNFAYSWGMRSLISLLFPLHDVSVLMLPARPRRLGSRTRDLPQQRALPRCLDRRIHQLDVQLRDRLDDQGHVKQHEVWHVHFLRDLQCSWWRVYLVVCAGDEGQDARGAGYLLWWYPGEYCGGRPRPHGEDQ
jgi:hypothetical protein